MLRNVPRSVESVLHGPEKIPQNSRQIPNKFPCEKQKNPPPKNPPKIKCSSEQVFLNNFRWVPGSNHRVERKRSRELLENVRVNGVFFWYFGIWGGFMGL